ncbi:MAG TPA: hypothetical protein VFR18_05320 [Terriglobia bacterium]|nr:hypothetical protein [Terriglobia bacterium]
MRVDAGEFWSARTILLAPPLQELTETFQSVQVDRAQHGWFLSQIQRLRGRVYLEDGAIEAHQLTADGRFVHPRDSISWQLLVTDCYGKISGCLRYSPSDHASFHHLDVSRSALACSDKWGRRLREAVEARKADAQRREISYAELGGWALTEQLRGTREALRMAMLVYALARTLGGAVATTTATTRHRSSTILKKVGGAGLAANGIELPSYYDPQYKCEMEILEFDSHCPNPKYKTWVDECQKHLATLPVISAETVRPGLDDLEEDFIAGSVHAARGDASLLTTTR